jgi:hypothetical protein
MKRPVVPFQIGQRREYVSQSLSALIYPVIDYLLSVVEQDNKSQDLEKPRHVGKGRKKELLQLERDRDGNPQLPSREKEPNANELRDIMRAFFTHSYSKLQSHVNPRG